MYRDYITNHEQDVLTGHSHVSVEQQLESSGQLTVAEARSMTIESQNDYEEAGKFLVGIKTMAKKVKDYWAKPKTTAKAAHQAIVDREKEMLIPLEEAERVIKRNMVKYQEAVEKARLEAERAARIRQQEEAERLLQLAVEADESGDEQDASINMAMAEMVSEMPVFDSIEAPAAVGTSVSKTWKARITNETLVPAYANGMELRKINPSALNNIARMTKGTAVIPGVEFYQDIGISARG